MVAGITQCSALWCTWVTQLFLGAKLQDGGTGDLCALNREDGNGGEDAIKPIDPLLQLITLFSQSALMERRFVFTAKDLIGHTSHAFTGKPHHQESHLIWQSYAFLLTAKSFISVFQLLSEKCQLPLNASHCAVAKQLLVFKQTAKIYLWNTLSL